MRFQDVSFHVCVREIGILSNTPDRAAMLVYVGFMLDLCWFEVPQTLVITDFMLVCYNFLYFSRKKK